MRGRPVLGLLLVVGASAVAGLFLVAVSDPREHEAESAGVADDTDSTTSAVLEGRRDATGPDDASLEPEIVLHDAVEEQRRRLGDEGLRGRHREAPVR